MGLVQCFAPDHDLWPLNSDCMIIFELSLIGLLCLSRAKAKILLVFLPVTSHLDMYIRYVPMWWRKWWKKWELKGEIKNVVCSLQTAVKEVTWHSHGLCNVSFWPCPIAPPSLTLFNFQLNSIYISQKLRQSLISIITILILSMHAPNWVPLHILHKP